VFSERIARPGEGGPPRRGYPTLRPYQSGERRQFADLRGVWFMRVRRTALNRLKALQEKWYSSAENDQNANDKTVPDRGDVQQYQRVVNDRNQGHPEDRAEDSSAAPGDPGATEDNSGDHIEL